VTTPDVWRKSSYSGGGDGNNCVEIAHLRTHIAIRDSKAPATPALSIPAATFATFINALKADPHSAITDFTTFRV
jgi:hypothetical protein